MSEVIGVVPKVLYGWIAVNKFPKPKYKDITGKEYYTIIQANALASILKKNLNGSGAFRSTNTPVIEKLHTKFKELILDNK